MAGKKKDESKEYSSNWGGARAGAGSGDKSNVGRKKLTESGRKQVQFSLQQSEIDLINELAEKAGLNKSRFIVEAVKAWQENNS